MPNPSPAPSGIPVGPENHQATARIRAFLDARYAIADRQPVLARAGSVPLLEMDLEIALQMVHLVSGLLDDQDSQEDSADVRP